MVCGLTRLAANDGIDLLARSEYVVTTRCIPKRVSGWFTRFRKTASVLFRSPTSRDNDVTVVDHNGQVRNLFPLPWRRTDGEPPNWRFPTVNFAASSARAPLLYRKSNRAWSRAPRLVRRSGWFNRASISAFSRYPIAVLAVFLNGTARTSAHQAKLTGERIPMKRASE